MRMSSRSKSATCLIQFKLAVFTEKLVAFFAFKRWVGELLAHYTNDFFNHFSLKLILNFGNFNIELRDGFRSHNFLNCLIWNNKILEFQQSFIDWLLRLSSIFLLHWLLYLTGNGSWSKSCVGTNWYFLNMWLSLNMWSINLWSLSGSKSLGWSRLLIWVAFESAWIAWLDNWISIDNSMVVDDWWFASSIIARIWYTS